MQSIGIKVVADFDKLVDQSARQRLESFIEACNSEPFSLENMDESAKHLKKEDDLFLRNHTNFEKVVEGLVKELRKVAVKKMIDDIFGEPRVATPQMPEIPVELIEHEMQVLKDWSNKFVATGHFVNSLAAVDFSEQLVKFMTTPPFMPPPEPRKIPALH